MDIKDEIAYLENIFLPEKRAELVEMKKPLPAEYTEEDRDLGNKYNKRINAELTTAANGEGSTIGRSAGRCFACNQGDVK